MCNEPASMTIDKMISLLKDGESIEFRCDSGKIDVVFSLYKNGLLNRHRYMYPDQKELVHDDWETLLWRYSFIVHRAYYDKIREFAEEYLKEDMNG